jgi:hypothetical protein
VEVWGSLLGQEPGLGCKAAQLAKGGCSFEVGSGHLVQGKEQQMPKIKNFKKIFYFGQGWATLVRTPQQTSNPPRCRCPKSKILGQQQGKSLRFALNLWVGQKIFLKNIFNFQLTGKWGGFQPLFQGAHTFSFQNTPNFTPAVHFPYILRQ